MIARFFLRLIAIPFILSGTGIIFSLYQVATKGRLDFGSMVLGSVVAVPLILIGMSLLAWAKALKQRARNQAANHLSDSLP